MPCGRPSAVGTGHSVNFSVCGSNRPSLFAPISANQMRPSGAATRQWGALLGVGMSYSTMDGLAVSPMATLQSVVAMRITDSLFETSDVRPQLR